MPMLCCERIITDEELAHLTKGGLERLQGRIVDILAHQLIKSIKKYGILTHEEDYNLAGGTLFKLSVIIDKPMEYKPTQHDLDFTVEYDLSGKAQIIPKKAW